MGCDTCAKILLVIVNIIFVLVGLALLVVGCLLKYGAVDFLNENIMNILGSVGGSSLKDGAIDFSSLVGTAALILIITGSIIFTIGFLGVCGACCTIRWMLLMYAVIISLILIIEVVGVILLFTLTDDRDPETSFLLNIAGFIMLSPGVENYVKKTLKTVLTDSYAGSTSQDAGSLAWNYVFVELDCCGVENYTDLYSAKSWNRNFVRPDTLKPITLMTPITCCILTGTFPDYNPPTNYDCVETPTTAISNYNTGCYDALKAKVESVGPYAIGVGVGIALVEILLLAAAISLFQSASPNKVHPR